MLTLLLLTSRLHANHPIFNYINTTNTMQTPKTEKFEMRIKVKCFLRQVNFICKKEFKTIITLNLN